MSLSTNELIAAGVAVFTILSSIGVILFRTGKLVARVENTEKNVQKIDGKIDDLASKVDHRFNALETKVDRKFEALETKVDQKFEALETKVDQRFEALETKFDRKFDRLNAKLDQILFKHRRT